MKFLSFFIVFAVCGNHVTTAAPKPKNDLRLKGDVRAVLRELLLKADQTTLDKWLGLDRDSEEHIISTTEPQVQEDEQLTTLTLLAEAPELLAISPPAPQKLILHPLCKERLNNPNQIEDINDIKNRHDVIEYLIYRLCLPTVTAEDVLQVSDILDRLSGPVSMPVIGLPNPFVPEVQTLVIDIDLLQGEVVTDVDQELTTRLLDDQEMQRTQVNDFDPDINDATIADDDEEVTQLEESDDDNGLLQNFLLKVDRTITTWLHLKRQEEEEDEDEGDKEDEDIYEEPFLATEEPAVSTDAYLMTASLPATEEPFLHPLCKDRLNNPNQIENIADVQNRYDVIEYLIYRLCLPSATDEDVAAVASIIEQLSWPVEVQPKPMFEPDVETDVEPQPVVEPEVQTLIIDSDLLQGEDGAVLEQELATKPLGDQDEAVTQAAPLDSDNDTNNDEADDEKIKDNTQKKKPAEQVSGTPTSSTSAESDEDDDEDNDAAQPLDIDSDELDMRIRELLDLFMN